MNPTHNLVGTMYVQMARSLVFDGSSIVLLDLSPATVLLGPSTGSEVGYLPTGLFLDHWYARDNDDRTSALRGVLSILDPDMTPVSDVSLLLSLPRIRGAGVEYQARVLSGQMPASTGACVLFISSS